MGKSNRLYSCTDDELPFVSNSIIEMYGQDEADFAAHSVLYTTDFKTNYLAKIKESMELVSSESETLLMTTITQGMNANMIQLGILSDKFQDYVRKGGKNLVLTNSNFGITALNTAIRNHDAEAVVANASLVLQNIRNYQEILMAQGLTVAQVEAFSSLRDSIATDKQKQKLTLDHRAALVLDNLELMNALYQLDMEVLTTGKLLYKRTDPEKAKRYTFTYHLKLFKQTKSAKASTDTTASREAKVAS